MKDQFELDSFSLDNTSISTRHYKKSATTKIVSTIEQIYTQECYRRYSHCQFSTNLTYAPFIHAIKAEILPSPITLRSSQLDTDQFQLNILDDELSILTEIEDENDFELLDEAPNDNIKLMRMYLKNSFDSLNYYDNGNGTLYKEAEMILNSEKIFSKLIYNSNISASKNVNNVNTSHRPSIWKNAIKQTMVTNNNNNSSTNNTTLSFNCSFRKSNNNTLNILNILETSVNEFVASDVFVKSQK